MRLPYLTSLRHVLLATALGSFGAFALADEAAQTERGMASWYADSLQGQRTASGERYDKAALTAAHRSLPLGSYVRVENLRNGRSVVVKINDRGPRPRHRIIDLSRAAAKQLRIIKAGQARVSITPVAAP